MVYSIWLLITLVHFFIGFILKESSQKEMIVSRKDRDESRSSLMVNLPSIEVSYLVTLVALQFRLLIISVRFFIGIISPDGARWTAERA
jgi:hypothetical protein